tara:strand:- start:863 stop:1111 length:249 start_codon:yes stop_codon:yes gene_type:complete
MADRFTITKTKRWGNADTQISNVFSTNRSQMKRDDVIRMANELMTKEEVYTNETVEYEVLLSYDNGNTEFIHRVEKDGKKSV